MSAHTVEAEMTPAFDALVVGRMAQAIGQRTYGPFDVPNGATQLRVNLDRTDSTFQALSSTSRCAEVMVDISYDNGATWVLLAGFTTSGGVDGATNESAIQLSVPQPFNPARLIQVRLTTDAAYTTACQVRWR